MYHALPCPRRRLVLIRDNNDDNEWGALGDRVLTTSTISYEPHINSRMVEGERTRNGSRKMEVEARDEAATGGKEIGIQKKGRPGGATSRDRTREEVPEEMWADFGAHGLRK